MRQCRQTRCFDLSAPGRRRQPRLDEVIPTQARFEFLPIPQFVVGLFFEVRVAAKPKRPGLDVACRDADRNPVRLLIFDACLPKRIADLGEASLETDSIAVNHYQQSDRLLGAPTDITGGFLEPRQNEREPSVWLTRLDTDAAAKQPFQERAKESLLFKVFTQ
jgi:hypothetical protein